MWLLVFNFLQNIQEITIFDFFPQININSFLINPTDKTEIKNNILSLHSLKSIGLNSISTKILKLLSNDMSTQFSELFNVSFSEGVFPSVLKACKVILIYKKDSQLNFSNYRPISPLIKFLKGVCIIACINF